MRIEIGEILSNNEYMAEYMYARYYRRKQAAIDFLGGCCVQCGTTKDLQFDHIDPFEKDFTLGKAFAGWAQSRLDEELKKCQLLCQDCHTLKTLEDLGRESAKGKHGTLSAYRYCGPPKCEACKDAYREYRKVWKKRSN